MNVKNCLGCNNNFYNGNNSLGVEKCWSLSSAKLIKRKRVPIDQRPPWNQNSEKLPDCYSEKGYIFTKPERTC